MLAENRREEEESKRKMLLKKMQREAGEGGNFGPDDDLSEVKGGEEDWVDSLKVRSEAAELIVSVSVFASGFDIWG